MDIKKEIINAINIIVERKLQKLTNNDISAIIEDFDASKNKYKVRINGVEKYVKDGVGVSPTIGSTVWVHLPNGSLKDAFIMAKK